MGSRRCIKDRNRLKAALQQGRLHVLKYEEAKRRIHMLVLLKNARVISKNDFMLRAWEAADLQKRPTLLLQPLRFKRVRSPVGVRV